MGILSGVAVLALVSVDDLARLAAKQLAAHSGNSEVAGSVAKSLKSAGVAFANPGTTVDYYFSIPACHAKSDHLEAKTYGMAFDYAGDPWKSQAISIVAFCMASPQKTTSDFDNCLISGYKKLFRSDSSFLKAMNQFHSCSWTECEAGYDGSAPTDHCYLDLFGPPTTPSSPLLLPPGTIYAGT